MRTRRDARVALAFSDLDRFGRLLILYSGFLGTGYHQIQRQKYAKIIIPLKSEMWDQHHFNNPAGHLNQGLDAARHYYNVELMAQRWQEQQERHLVSSVILSKKKGRRFLPKRWDFGVL